MVKEIVSLMWNGENRNGGLVLWLVMLKLVKCSPLYGANRSCSFQSLSTHVLRTCLIFHYFFLIKQTNYFFSILTLMVYIYIQLYFSYKKKKEEPIEIREREREREWCWLLTHLQLKQILQNFRLVFYYALIKFEKESAKANAMMS